MSIMMLIPVGVNANSKKSDGCEDVGDIFSDFCFGYDFGLGEVTAVASEFGAKAKAVIDACFANAGADASVSKDGAKAGAGAGIDIGIMGADADAWAKLDKDGVFKAGAKAASFVGKLFGNAWATVEIDGCDIDFDFDWDWGLRLARMARVPSLQARTLLQTETFLLPVSMSVTGSRTRSGSKNGTLRVNRKAIPYRLFFVR